MNQVFIELKTDDGMINVKVKDIRAIKDINASQCRIFVGDGSFMINLRREDLVSVLEGWYKRN